MESETLTAQVFFQLLACILAFFSRVSYIDTHCLSFNIVFTNCYSILVKPDVWYEFYTQNNNIMNCWFITVLCSRVWC